MWAAAGIAGGGIASLLGSPLLGGPLLTAGNHHFVGVQICMGSCGLKWVR